MHLREFTLKNLAITALGLGVFVLDRYTNFLPRYTEWLVVGISLSKVWFVVWQSLRKIFEVVGNDEPFYRFLVFMCLNVLTITFSFGVDFFCLHLVQPRSFTGLDPALTGLERAFEFYYFSVLGFTNFGYGEIFPRTIPAKIIIMVEDMLSFMTIILVLSDFVSLKESLVNSEVLRRRKLNP